MTSRAIALIVSVVVGVAFLCVAGLFALTGAASACSVITTASGTTGRYDTQQVHYAQVIVTVGVQNTIPVRGQVIAVATALQESGLRNLGHLGENNDHDSLGLFQQRPSQGWGTPAQIMDPEYAAGAFYRKLVTVPGWQTMPLTVAAQAVQRSAYPDAYAKWEDDATALVGLVASDSCVEAGTVFGRAQSWLTAWSGGPVPYVSSGDPEDWFQGYRRDCSGYVSMALGLDGPGLTTSGLAARSTIISKSDLRPGDLLINTAPDLRGHVVLFERWVDASMTRYYGYEQSGDGGTHYRSIPYPYFGDYPMVPYRFGRSG